MKLLTFLAIIATAALTACSSKGLPGSVRSVSVAPSAKRTPLVLAPKDEDYFKQMAEERNTWTVNALRAAIQRELAAGGRFQASPTGAADAEIVIETLRHGLIEVSPNNYAVQVSGSASVLKGGKEIASRDLGGVSGEIRPLKDFEDSRIYEPALQGVLDKVALELVTTL